MTRFSVNLSAGSRTERTDLRGEGEISGLSGAHHIASDCAPAREMIALPDYAYQNGMSTETERQ